MSHKIRIVFTTLIVFFILISCSNNFWNNDGYVNPDPDDPDDKTVETYLFDRNDPEGNVWFYTNDTKYFGFSGNGTTVTRISGDTEELPMNSVKTNVKKVSGNGLGGYGIIFCASDPYNFLFVQVRIDGKYYIGKKVSTETYARQIKDWTDSTFLTTGYSAENSIAVDYLGSNQFRIFFNDNTADTFTDDTTPQFTGGKYGYSVEVTSTEEFPNTPVDVLFKQVTP
jgi:hypothetical protein